MRILVIFAHPGTRSFNRALLNTVLEVAAEKGHECDVHDLYAQSFRAVLTEADIERFDHGDIPEDIRAEQDALRQADVVLFIHPIWWFGLPAILKGWIDRIFSYGFAYGHDSHGIKPLLRGKKAMVVTTAGGADTAEFQDAKKAMDKLIDEGIYQFVGLDIILHRIFYQVPSATEVERREMLALLRSDLRSMF